MKKGRTSLPFHGARGKPRRAPYLEAAEAAEAAIEAEAEAEPFLCFFGADDIDAAIEAEADAGADAAIDADADAEADGAAAKAEAANRDATRAAMILDMSISFE